MAKILFIEGSYYIRAIHNNPPNAFWEAWNTGNFPSKHIAEEYLKKAIIESKEGTTQGENGTLWFSPKDTHLMWDAEWDAVELQFRNYTVDSFYITDDENV